MNKILKEYLDKWSDVIDDNIKREINDILSGKDKGEKRES